jgi:hypothetical protein
LPRAQAGFAEESFAEWSNTRRLSNEALVLRIGIAEDVIRVGRVDRPHRPERGSIVSFLFPLYFRASSLIPRSGTSLARRLSSITSQLKLMRFFGVKTLIRYLCCGR